MGRPAAVLLSAAEVRDAEWQARSRIQFAVEAIIQKMNLPNGSSLWSFSWMLIFGKGIAGKHVKKWMMDVCAVSERGAKAGVTGECEPRPEPKPIQGPENLLLAAELKTRPRQDSLIHPLSLSLSPPTILVLNHKATILSGTHCDTFIYI